MKTCTDKKPTSVDDLGVNRFFSELEIPTTPEEKKTSKIRTIEILKINPHLRNKQQVLELTSYLEGFEYFKEYINAEKREVVHKCSKQLRWRHFRKGDYIMKQGDFAQEFYIILKGKIGVYLEATRNIECTFRELLQFIYLQKCLIQSINGKHPSKSLLDFAKVAFEEPKINNVIPELPLRLRNLTYESLSPRMSEMSMKLYGKAKETYDIEFLVHLSELNHGKIFGEIGLLEGKPRSATLIASEDTWCAGLTKDSFGTILKKFERDKILSLIEDLDHFLNFKSLTRAHKIKLFKGITQVEFTRNQIIYDEGEPSDCLYFLLEGEYEISKTFTVSSHEEKVSIEYHKMNPSTGFTDLLIEENMADFMKKNKSIFDISTKKSLKILPENCKRVKKSLRIWLLNNRCIIGDEELIVEDRNMSSNDTRSQRFFKVRCISNSGKAFRMSYAEFDKRVKNKNTLSCCLHSVMDKLNLLDKRIKKLDVLKKYYAKKPQTSIQEVEAIQESKEVLNNENEKLFVKTLKGIIRTPRNRNSSAEQGADPDIPITSYYKQLILDKRQTTNRFKRLMSHKSQKILHEPSEKTSRRVTFKLKENAKLLNPKKMTTKKRALRSSSRNSKNNSLKKSSNIIFNVSQNDLMFAKNKYLRKIKNSPRSCFRRKLKEHTNARKFAIHFNTGACFTPLKPKPRRSTRSPFHDSQGKTRQSKKPRSGSAPTILITSY
ncbi:unnamed protein product [Moneuplotes crassus]|uniref:Cyclic nucleotide-binding domain-containing protein n=1 Tax=Euplotes crassus TaxID=5936 RepID=A0AAD2D2H0_EUPCR|nr:unnamed protein product [Moneuplotes crassus]